MLLHGLLHDFWDNLYPQIEDGDLEYRSGPLEFVNEKLTVLVRCAPLTNPSTRITSYNVCYTKLLRGGVLLCIMLIVAIILLWKVLERRRADRMEEALTQDAQARAQQRQQVKVAVAGIKERWSEAMLTLKETKVRLYDLPWILLIGEPHRITSYNVCYTKLLRC